MVRYETKNDRLQKIVNAIQAVNETTESAIYIDLIVITKSSEKNPSLYMIKHGTFFPEKRDEYFDKLNNQSVIQVYKATWEQNYIDGKDDGFPNGFMNLNDVSKFIDEEIDRINKKIQECIISNDNSSIEGGYYDNGIHKNYTIPREKWELILQAWTNFRLKFHKSWKEGKLISKKEANEMHQSLMN